MDSRYNGVGGAGRNKTPAQRRDPTAAARRMIEPTLPRKAAFLVEELPTVPETDSGGRVEYTEAFERTVVKELGKLTP